MFKHIKCTVQYDGSKFFGYQKQIGHRTVQQEIEKALTTMHQTQIVIHASGRTDTGVHALGQVFHFKTKLEIDPLNWKRAINSLLPEDIYIKDVEVVDESFHSRYSVKIKEYRYYLSLNEYNPLRYQYVSFNRDLDVEKMKIAIKLFEGTHDFSSFSSGKEDKNRIRTIYEATIKENDNELEFIFRGNGFLRYQVRIMVGTLIEIGKNKREIESITKLFELKDRRLARYTADPQGLYLHHVEY